MSGSALKVQDLVANTNATILSSSVVNAYSGITFSGNSRFCAYAARTNSGDQYRVYFYDFEAGTNLMVSPSSGPSVYPNGNSDSPAVSYDGRFVAYRSFATNIVANDANDTADIFLHDRVANATVLLSANVWGGTSAGGAGRSYAPLFSRTDRTLLFKSWAPDLADDDFNSSVDLFSMQIATAEDPGFSARSVYVPAAGNQVMLVWPVAPGSSYRVEYKNNVTDSGWLPMNGSVQILGGHAYATDISPGEGQRFYRLVEY